MTGRNFTRRTLAERRKAWRAEVSGSPLEWDAAYGWLRVELAALERAAKRSLILRLRSRRTLRTVRRDATRILLPLAIDGVPAALRDGPGYTARAAEMAGAATDDERLWRARGWLVWTEAHAVIGERERADATTRLAMLCERLAAFGGER